MHFGSANVPNVFPGESKLEGLSFVRTVREGSLSVRGRYVRKICAVGLRSRVGWGGVRVEEGPGPFAKRSVFPLSVRQAGETAT